MKNLRVLVVCKDAEHTKESQACAILEKENLDVVYAWKNALDKNHLQNIDFIISIGGDGTVLSASHYLRNKPILAVNSSPSTSIGALTTLSSSKLSEKLKEIKMGNFKTEYLERIEVSINNKVLDHLALNDVFIASEKAHLISKYKIKLKDKEENQLSSGLIFSTGTGSTAWFKSAGGIPFSPQSKYIKMIVREPYHNRLIKFSILNADIQENEYIEIIPKVPSILAIDSIREHKLNPNDKVQIKISKDPLKRII